MASSGSFSFGCSAAGPLLPPPSFSFPNQPAASSFPFTNDPAPTPCRHAPVHPATSPSEDSQAPVPAGFAPVLPSASPREALPKAPVPTGSAPVRPSASPREALPKAPVPSGSAPVRPSAPLAGAFPLAPNAFPSASGLSEDLTSSANPSVCTPARSHEGRAPCVVEIFAGRATFLPQPSPWDFSQ